MNRHKTLRGFTLTEIMVVILILVVVMSILTATLSAARRTARRVACLSNLREMEMSFAMYCNQNQGRSILPISHATQFWATVLTSYNSNITKNLLCPEATVLSNSYGTASKTWGPNAPDGSGWMGNTDGSYGMNSWVYIPQNPSSLTSVATLMSATSSIQVNGHQHTITGNVQAGTSYTGNGNPTVTGTITQNSPSAVPNVVGMYNSLSGSAYPLSGTANTIDFSSHSVLICTGDYSPSGQVTVTGSGTLLVSGNFTVSSQLPKNGSAYLNVICLGNMSISGQATIVGSMYVAGSWDVGGGIDLTGIVNVIGAVTFRGNGSLTYGTPPSFDPRWVVDNFNNLGIAPAAKVPVFVDAIWTEGMPSASDTVPANLSTGFYSSAGIDMMGRFCIDRHNRAVNIAYLDGHAATVNLGDLWQQQWSKSYQPVSMKVP